MNKGITDSATCQSTSNEKLMINIGPLSSLILPPRPAVDLILGIPRPRILPNMLSTIACLGVNQLILVKSAKVDRNYMSRVSSYLLITSNRFSLLSRIGGVRESIVGWINAIKCGLLAAKLSCFSQYERFCAISGRFLSNKR